MGIPSSDGVPSRDTFGGIRPADAHAKVNDGWAPLHWAAMDGGVEAIRILLAAGADVNVRNVDWTPLHLAAVNGHVEAVRLLLAAGADVGAHNVYGETPLDVVKDAECRELLAEALAKAALGSAQGV